MALAKKCDRCGKLYEHYPIGNQSGIFNGIKLVRIGENGSFDHAKNHNDLCPECMEAIKAFLSNDAYVVRKGEKRETEI